MSDSKKFKPIALALTVSAATCLAATTAHAASYDYHTKANQHEQQTKDAYKKQTKNKAKKMKDKKKGKEGSCSPGQCGAGKCGH